MSRRRVAWWLMDTTLRADWPFVVSTFVSSRPDFNFIQISSVHRKGSRLAKLGSNSQTRHISSDSWTCSAPWEYYNYHQGITELVRFRSIISLFLHHQIHAGFLFLRWLFFKTLAAGVGCVRLRCVILITQRSVRMSASREYILSGSLTCPRCSIVGFSFSFHSKCVWEESIDALCKRESSELLSVFSVVKQTINPVSSFNRVGGE